MNLWTERHSRDEKHKRWLAKILHVLLNVDSMRCTVVSEKTWDLKIESDRSIVLSEFVKRTNKINNSNIYEQIKSPIQARINKCYPLNQQHTSGMA
jgi:hypothetical protein